MPHKVTQHMTTTRILELLHMNLMGTMQVESLGGKRFAFMRVEKFSKYSWVQFPNKKLDTFDAFEVLFLRLILEANLHHKKAARIMSDHGREFENSHFDNFCNKHGIRHEYSTPKSTKTEHYKKWHVSCSKLRRSHYNFGLKH